MRSEGSRCRGPVLAFFGALQLVSLVHSAVGAGHCESVFRGFSDCLLTLGDNMANYPQDLDDRQNLHRICTYWDSFHSCAATALTDCQEGATEMWEKLKKESRNLDFRGSLFELCAGGNGSQTHESHFTFMTLTLVSLLLIYFI